MQKVWIDEKININKYIGEAKDTVRKIKNGELYSYEYITPDGQRIKVRDLDDVPKNETVYGKSIGESGSNFGCQLYKGTRKADVDFVNGKGKSTLNKHAGKHGYTSPEEYLKDARNFLEKNPTSTTQSFVSNEGTYFR